MAYAVARPSAVLGFFCSAANCLIIPALTHTLTPTHFQHTTRTTAR